MVAPRLEAHANEEAPHPDSPWWGIHAARYRLAANSLDFHRLLDVACGSGYGLVMLSRGGRAVVGVDEDRDALAEAASAAPVIRADASALPFRANAFDAITTFETIEHLPNRKEFVAELARILTSTGVVLLSTPNALYTEPVDGRPRNPFHVFEYTPDELLDEVRPWFEHIELYGQQLDPRFVISPFEDDQRRMPSTPRARARLLIWRVINKLPPRARDAVSRLLWRHPLYPGEADYVFAEELVATAPVLVARARSPRRRSVRAG